MKKKLTIAVVLFLCFSSAAYAENEDEYKYKSSAGNQYKYDLSKPQDQIKYGVDPNAQLHDKINPRVDIDRGLGQHGGGIKH